MKDGFDPANTTDPLFIVDNEAKSYRAITTDVMSQVAGGSIRL